MTALTEYQRLELPAIWRADPEDQRRDVIVSLGDATLVIYDGAGRPLAHWSLAAVERLNPSIRPALYRPGPDSPEELEVTDTDLETAIERIRAAIDRRRPRQGRLRYVLLAGALVAVLAAGVLWLPDAMIRHAAAVVPAAKRADLGARLLDEVRRLTGPPCSTELGDRAVGELEARLLGGSGRLVVLPDGISDAAHLPGGIVLVSRALVEEYDDPSVVAGYVLAEVARAAAVDPVERMLRVTGPMVAFRLLTTGDVREATLAGYAEALLTAPPDPVADRALLERFAAVEVPASPYAYAVDASGETTLGLIEADPVDPTFAPPVLRDAEWVSLQGICRE
ncbi:hypothetical protein P1J78_20515 [Psychromarinibacter sp. C21-152]|uniref:Uncharacterized protein n=1 Tax=Psychromarinibacter sediminicola TaxID=3033385 RepID=A0AAE3NW63_9RHOB|nr:hypothetical protein [Psychromarinibacter sediminicola]MDF0603136.1 hypothetical protein [Psychromarinibacter sediminicola]